MKKIDQIDRHLTEEDALEATADRKLREAAPEANRQYEKEDYYGARAAREKYVQQDRRRFLDLVAKSGISAGLLRGSALIGGVLANRHALAADLTNKRVVFCYINSGAATGTWMPSSATQMNTSTKPYGPSGYSVADICNFRQVDVLMAGHSSALQALGVINYSGESMDKRIAKVLGATTPKSSIYLGAKATTSGALCSNVGPCQDNPTQALADVFSGLGGGGGGSNSSADTTFKLAYDAQLKAIDSLKTKLGTDELERLQTHADAVTKIKTNIANAQASSTGGTTTTNCGSGLTTSVANMQVYGKSQADIIVAALACGITKVATLQLGNHQGDWVGHNTVYKGDDHGAAHSTPDNKAFQEMVAYISDVPAYFIDKLRKTNGPDGQPLINTTVFVQVTCMGNGMTHDSQGAPFIVATKMPGFKSGYSASSGGTVQDLIGAIPTGLGLDGLLTGMGSSKLGLV